MTMFFCILMFQWILLAQSSNANIRALCEIYSKLTIKIPERRQLLILNIFTDYPGVSIVDFEQIYTVWKAATAAEYWKTLT